MKEITKQTLNRIAATAYNAYKAKWLKERGYDDIYQAQQNGESYACYNEFYDNEFQIPEIIKPFITAKEYDYYMEHINDE